MNKSQAKKKVYTFHAVFRVDVNDVKPFHNPTETSPFDHSLDRQSMQRLFFKKKKKINQWLIQTYTYTDPVLAVYYGEGGGGQAGYAHTKNDYVIDNNVQPAVN